MPLVRVFGLGLFLHFEVAISCLSFTALLIVIFFLQVSDMLVPCVG